MSKCRGCGAEIIWAITDARRPIPLDAKPEKRFITVKVGSGGEIRAFTQDTYISHFATCPNADKFRKEKKNA